MNYKQQTIEQRIESVRKHKIAILNDDIEAMQKVGKLVWPDYDKEIKGNLKYYFSCQRIPSCFIGANSVPNQKTAIPASEFTNTPHTMDKSTHGSEPVRTEKTGRIKTRELSIQEVVDLGKNKPHSDRVRTAIAIEVLREKIEELEVAYIGEYESITGRRLDITYLRKSIELLTKK